MPFHRYRSDHVSPHAGETYGIFIAVWHLIRDKQVTPADEAEYWEQRRWFEANLPIPPFYAEGNPLRAIAWFKDSTLQDPVLDRLSFYRDLAARHGLNITLETTNQPGTIIYEDRFQIAAWNRPESSN